MSRIVLLGNDVPDARKKAELKMTPDTPSFYEVSRLDPAAFKHPARELLIDRYCELQPQLQRRLSALLHGEVGEELHAVTEHQRVVLTLLRGQSVTMRELAKQLEVGESAATAVVDRLVRQGLVVRHDDPSDRRVVRLELSDEGHSVVTDLQAKACSKTASLLSVLSDDQLSQLIGIMETLDKAANDINARHKIALHDNKHKEHV
ncbi:MAG: MarR family transcriptional regulator [Acidimicrobiales bacterium]|jgi:DNA-binding MarR family transcriptional regulator